MGVNIGQMIMAMLLAVIGLALTPVVTSSTNAIINDGNSSSAVRLLVAIVPIVYVTLIIGGLAAFLVVSVKGLGK